MNPQVHRNEIVDIIVPKSDDFIQKSDCASVRFIPLFFYSDLFNIFPNNSSIFEKQMICQLLEFKKSIKNLENINLSRIYSFSFTKKHNSLIPLLLTENPANGTLNQYLTNKLYDSRLKLFSNEEKFKICYGIASGMEHLHKNKIIHGNLNPSNILLDSNNNPRIDQFYFPKVEGINIYSKMKKTVFRPSKFDENDLKEEYDIYSYGLLVYSVFTGNFPPELIDIPFLLSELPNEFETIVSGCLKYEIKSFSQILQKLDEISSNVLSKKETLEGNIQPNHQISNQDEEEYSLAMNYLKGSSQLKIPQYNLKGKQMLEKCRLNKAKKRLHEIDQLNYPYFEPFLIFIDLPLFEMNAFKQMANCERSLSNNCFQIKSNNSQLSMFPQQMVMKKIDYVNWKSKQDVKNLTRTINQLSSFKNLNILPILGIIYDENQKEIWILREFMEKNLNELFGQNIFRDFHGDIIFSLVSTLSHLSSKNIFHTRLKPENILFDEKNNPYITDFNLF